MKREREAPSRAFSALRLAPFVYLLLIQTGRRTRGQDRVCRRGLGLSKDRDGGAEGQNASGAGGGENAQPPWEAAQ